MTYLYFKTLVELAKVKSNFTGGFICHLEDDIAAAIGLDAVYSITRKWLSLPE